jgi:hypothetical protein
MTPQEAGRRYEHSHAEGGNESVAKKRRPPTALLMECSTSVTTKGDDSCNDRAEAPSRSATCGILQILRTNRRAKCMTFLSSRWTAKGQCTRQPRFTGNRLRSWCPLSRPGTALDSRGYRKADCSTGESICFFPSGIHFCLSGISCGSFFARAGIRSFGDTGGELSVVNCQWCKHRRESVTTGN